MPRAAIPSGRKFLLLLLALAAAIIGGAWWWTQRPPPEPVHNGERLSEWLARASQAGLPPEEVPQVFGTAALPWLAYTLEHGRHPFIHGGPLPFDNAPDWLRRWLPEKWGGPQRSEMDDERAGAAMALATFGSKAAPCIPALKRNLESEDLDLCLSAAYALHSIGSASWPIAKDALEHGSVQAKRALLEWMQVRFLQASKDSTGAEFAGIIETLATVCRDSDTSVRAKAAYAIGEGCAFSPDPTLSDSAFPVLAQLLSDSSPEVRESAAEAIYYFDTKATAAIPRLIELLDDKNVSVRRVAAFALARVDIAEKRSAPRLRAMLHDPAIQCQKEAASVLALFGLPPEEENTSLMALPGQ